MSYGGRGLTSFRARRLGALDDMPGGGQVAVEGTWAYVGHMNAPHGTSIIDVADPRAPRVVARIPCDAASHTHKVRVAGDVMIVNVERSNRHFKRRAAQIAPATAALTVELGRAPTDAELAARIGVPADRMDALRAAGAEDYRDGGFKVFDIRDRAAPRLLAHVRTGGVGVHRFDMDEGHAYISTEMDGYVGNILMVYSLADPSKPVEGGRFHAPGQHAAAGETPTWDGLKHRLHHAMRVGDEFWAAWWHQGFRVLDARDLSAIREIGRWDRPAAFPEPTHTAMPLPGLTGGRRYALSVDEEHDHRHGAAHGFLWALDVTDLSDIRPVATFEVSELDSPYARAGGRFGAHQFAERLHDRIAYCAWFAGGLRVVDLSDPLRPTEVAHFIPDPRGANPAPQTNDADVDGRGLIHLIDRNQGYDVIERQEG